MEGILYPCGCMGQCMGGAKVCFEGEAMGFTSWFCMDGGDEQAFLRSLDVSANLNQEVKEVEEHIYIILG